jgi:putative transposase
MKMYLSHRIKLKLTPEQEIYCAKAAGTARYAYNWAWRENYKLYKEGKKTSAYDMVKLWNAYRDANLRWSYEVTKWAGQKAIYNFYDSLTRFFKKVSKYPRKKRKKRSRDSFYLGVNTFKVEGNRIHIPILKWVEMHQELRFPGKQISAVISRDASGWYASIQVELPENYTHKHQCQGTEAVGVDLGVGGVLATLSNGTKYLNPRSFRRSERKIRQKSKAVSRKKLQSKNRERAVRRLAKEHLKLKRRRLDNTHKITTSLVKQYKVIGIETLNVKGMAKTKLAKSVYDAGMYEFRRQLEYKAKLAGSTVFLADRFYPSSKTCSSCGHRLDKLELSVREWECPQCTAKHDRDINAAINLRALAVRHTDNKNACGDDVRLSSNTELLSAKQESETSS